MRITKSATIQKGHYSFSASENLSVPVILIEGNNITVDFNQAILTGNIEGRLPDQYIGAAVIIRNSKNVTIKNLNARGYKVALLARNSQQLVLENCDFSYNYRQHLNSTQEKEDIADWMSYHHNENDEWLRYGAAIYLRGCRSFTVRNCRVTGGQNALMLTESDEGMIYNNDFSFNSGIGVGLYRSSGNSIMHNRIIFNVRGYSHGVYNRGQDSAGILVYEQSSNNIFYKNNVTHSGDGFFLWAGQTTMDSGQGGCNDNLVMGNDFSYAPTNGVEVTFSRNKIIDNRMYECDYGIWGGYSYESEFSKNKFRGNRIALAIEHGQQNRIAYNLFYKDKEAIRLWAKNEQPADWGYARNRDTKSRDYEIVANNFTAVPDVFNFNRTRHLSIFNNIFSGCGSIFKYDSSVQQLDTTVNDRLATESAVEQEYKLPRISKTINPFINTAGWAGRKNIRITEWGPYDFKSPVIWHINPVDSGDIMNFELLGPEGKWVIKNHRGVKNISAFSGKFPASLSAEKIKSDRVDIFIELEFTGKEIITPFGEKVKAGKKYPFYFRKFFQPIDWEINWFGLDTAVFNPVKSGRLFAPGIRLEPVRSERKNKLDYAWWGGIKDAEGKPLKQFITSAEGQAVIPAGEYELGVTWDDAVRVYVDSKLVIDEWNPSRYSFDESPHKKTRIMLGGNHLFRVEHVELGGFACLSLKIKQL